MMAFMPIHMDWRRQSGGLMTGETKMQGGNSTVQSIIVRPHAWAREWLDEPAEQFIARLAEWYADWEEFDEWFRTDRTLRRWKYEKSQEKICR